VVIVSAHRTFLVILVKENGPSDLWVLGRHREAKLSLVVKQISKMAMHKTFWHLEEKSLKADHKEIVARHPEADSVLKQTFRVLGDIVSLARNTPDSVGDGEEWKQVICNIIEDKTHLCSLLQGKRLYCALYGMYTVVLSDLTDIFQRGACSTITDGSIAAAAAGPPRKEPSSDEFREQRRRKRNNSSDGEVRSLKKPAQTDPEKTQSIGNYFAQLRTAEMHKAEWIRNYYPSQNIQYLLYSGCASCLYTSGQYVRN
jgi:hypothetical protein